MSADHDIATMTLTLLIALPKTPSWWGGETLPLPRNLPLSAFGLDEAAPPQIEMAFAATECYKPLCLRLH